MRALVTGIGGFAGRYLARHLLSEGDTVFGLVRKGRHHQDADLFSSVTILEADLLSRADLARVLDQSTPDVVYHLAAQASVAASLEDPIPTFETNVIGQATLFESILATGARPRVLVVGSNEEYGPVPPDLL